VPTAIAQNLTLTADPTGTANGSIDNGSSDPDGDPLTITQSPAGPYPVGVTPVLLTVRDPKGATSQASANVTVLPSVTSITPATGPASGDTIVTITGTGFSTTTGATTVAFGATPAAVFPCTSSTSCQAIAPAGSGTVSVRVTVAGLTSADTPADDFTYIAPVLFTGSATATKPAPALTTAESRARQQASTAGYNQCTVADSSAEFDSERRLYVVTVTVACFP
jgi:IPT/TIG domain